RRRKGAKFMPKILVFGQAVGEESYPQIPPPKNGEWLYPKFEKSEIGNFRKQNQFSPKIKFGGYG
ncbi:hypothetical protein, partial [Petralouisia muris]|uniref:hypothetical protein n=1 Tax=Petralouisia muris TaxID=3032872 RepID=UPI0023B87680